MDTRDSSDSDLAGNLALGCVVVDLFFFHMLLWLGDFQVPSRDSLITIEGLRGLA